MYVNFVFLVCTGWGIIEYKFGAMSDDASEVWFSSDHQPAKLKMTHVLCLGSIDPSE